MKVGGGGGEVSFLSSPPPPRSFTCAIFRRSLTVVPRSFLLNRTETLATQAICFIVFFFLGKKNRLIAGPIPHIRKETQLHVRSPIENTKIFQVKPLITLIKISLKRPPFVNDPFFLTTCERPLDVWSDLCFMTTPLVECKELLVTNQPSSQGPLSLGPRL